MGRVPALIRKLLIANRGEIAVRIERTARSLGILTVVVYTDFDRESLHVARADEAVRVASYLDVASILDAARRTSADAIHPGYGFLAENADFAEACESPGILFIGPKPDVIRCMGLKDAARAIAIQASVPVVPEGGGFPLLIKAAAGGGGRGMRIVRHAAELEAAEAAARSEAERAFGNGALLHERYIENARHVEVQIFGDHHGNVVHLWERDCSIQRRYQKIIEESPSPALSAELRTRICDAAVKLGKAMGYTNAGTVEFLLAPSGEFYFIEVNTRIQVEHPVTEMVTHLDLIRMQIEVAEGRPLDVANVTPSGHAIEARLYAEDPANGFVPSTGRLDVWRMPDGVRIDTGVQAGTEIGVHYDPMLAKVIAWAPDRERAIRKLAHTLGTMAVGGVETNREFLIQVLEHADFREGRAHTGWRLNYVRDSSQDEAAAEAVAEFMGEQLRARFGEMAFWRNNPWRAPSVTLEVAGTLRRQEWRRGTQECVRHRVTPADEYLYYVGSTAVRRVPRFPESTTKPQHETANAPMPGTVLRIAVTEGQTVKAGDPLLVLEAMKMEQTIKTTIDGRVRAILVKQGQVVAPGQMLIEIDSMENAHEHTSHSTNSD